MLVLFYSNIPSLLSYLIGEVVTGGGTVVSRQQPPLELLAAGILLARLVGLHRKPWAQAIIGRTRPSFRVERTTCNGAGGPVARLAPGGMTPFFPGERKSVGGMHTGSKSTLRGRKVQDAVA